MANNNSSWLDVGCGDRPYEYLFKNGKYTGIDIEDSGRPKTMKNPDYFYDGKNIPFENEKFDFILCTQVLEHVPNPSLLINEMKRVCKTGGGIIITLPFVYPEHEQPYDFFRFTRFGIIKLLEDNDLEVIDIKQDSTAIETIAILINVYIITNLAPKTKGSGRIISTLFCFPIQLIALILSSILPNKSDLYLNLVVHARKK